MKNVSKVLIILTILILGLSSVKAVNNNFNIENINIEDKTDTINVSTPIYDENNIDSKIEFNKVGDYIKYKIILKNNDNKIYRIKKIEDNNDTQYINVSYDYKKDEINPKEQFEIYVTLKYIDEVYDDKLIYNLEDISLKIQLEEIVSKDKNLEEKNEVIIEVNPSTNDNIKKYVIIFLITIISIITLIKTKRKVFIIPIIIVLGMTGYVKAENNKELIINLKNNTIKIDTNKFNDITNSELGISKENIENIYFVTKKSLPESIDGSFDISIFGDNQTIEYYIKNGNYYDLYIVSKNDYSKYNSKDLSRLFYGYNNLKSVDLSYLDLSNITNMYGMFYNDKKLENIIWPEKIDTKKVTDMGYLFANCNNLTEIDTSKFDTSSVTNMKYMFAATKVENLDLSNFDTSNVTDMYGMFYKDSELKNINIKSFDTSNVTTMKALFHSCSSLENIDLSNFNTSNVHDYSSMFRNCSSLKNLDLSNFNTIQGENMQYMFFNCNMLENINLSSFDTSNVNDMQYMFCNCSSLNELDITNFDTSNVTNFDSTFRNCNKLTELNLSNFNTSNATLIRGMFYDCSNLKTLDLSSFDTRNVEDISWLFRGCENLESINLSSFDTSNVIDMNHMFTYCYALKSINLLNFDTSKVTSLNGLFYGCTSIEEIDLTNFDTSKVTDTTNMFGYCNNLKTIYASDKFVTDNIINSTNMFRNDKKIIGGNGTVFNSSQTNSNYARIDTEDNPGYFTKKN